MTDRAVDDIRYLPWEAKRPQKPKRRPALPGLTIWQLQDHHCRWPIGEDPPYRFCGTDKQPGQPYCAEHTKLAFKRGA